MSANNLDRQAEERLITEIKDLRRQVSELRTLQNQGDQALEGVLNVYRSARFTSSLTLSAKAGGYFGIFVWFTDVSGKRIFGVPEYTFYEDNTAADNAAKIIGSAANNYRDHYTIHAWPNEYESDEDVMVYWIYVWNNDTVSHSVTMAGRSRWLFGTTTAGGF